MMARHSPNIEVIEVFDEKGKPIEEIRKESLRLFSSMLLNVMKELLSNGYLEVKAGKIVPTGKTFEEKEIVVDIYALCDPRTNEVVYVGQTRNMHSRIKAHKHTGVPMVKAWIKNLVDAGLEPEVRILETVSLKEANAAEEKWIKNYSSCGTLLNTVLEGSLAKDYPALTQRS